MSNVILEEKKQNRFLEIVLLIAIIAIIGLWYKHSESSTIASIINHYNNKALASSTANGLIVNNIELPPENNKTRLLNNQRGINIGFHQAFKKSIPNELGWRSFYMRNFSGLENINQNAYNNTNREGSNYLECLGNTDNVYKYVDY